MNLLWLIGAMLLADGHAAGEPTPHGPIPVGLEEGEIAAGAPAEAGTIRGRVIIDTRPTRRRVNRYGGRIEAPRTPQEIPTAVYLREPISGHAAGLTLVPRMVQRDTAFVEPLLFVPVGTEVAFPNEDPFLHNVFSYSPAARFDLGRYAQGSSKSVLFEAPGEVSVMCEVHDTMRALVVVVHNPFHAPVNADGSFVLDGVPAGTYTLVVTHSDLGTREQVVTVRDGAVTEVEVTLG